MKITLIIGLPASGKTTYANTLGGTVIDDPQNLSEVKDNNCEHLIIVDPYFCRPNTVEIAEVILRSMYNVESLEKIYFENDPEQCLKNAKNRENKKVDIFINRYSETYEIPEGSIVLPCYKGKE